MLKKKLRWKYLKIKFENLKFGFFFSWLGHPMGAKSAVRLAMVKQHPYRPNQMHTSAKQPITKRGGLPYVASLGRLFFLLWTCMFYSPPISVEWTKTNRVRSIQFKHNIVGTYIYLRGLRYTDIEVYLVSDGMALLWLRRSQCEAASPCSYSMGSRIMP